MRRSLTTAETVRLRSDSGRAARERTKSITEIRNWAGPVGNGVLSHRGRAGSVAVMGGDSAGVSQTDARWPWAAAAAAWLVIHGASAGTRRKSQQMSSAWQRRHGA